MYLDLAFPPLFPVFVITTVLLAVTFYMVYLASVLRNVEEYARANPDDDRSVKELLNVIFATWDLPDVGDFTVFETSSEVKSLEAQREAC